MAHNDPSQRGREAAGRVRDKDKPKELAAEEQVSVLHDSEGLKEAALAASNGGKKRIVGLYLPDGNRIFMEERKEVKDKDSKDAKKEPKKEAKKKKGFSLTGGSGMSQQDFATEAARKKTNLSQVGHTYGDSMSYGQRRAAKMRRSQEEIEDERADTKAKGILSKANEVDKQQYNDLFNFFDVDKDRTWGSIEFAQRMTDIGFKTGVEDAANLLYFAGVRDVDRITYNDFVEMMPKLVAFRRCIEKDAMRAFSEKDDGTGFISLKALKDLLKNMAGPEGIDDDFVEAIVKKSDREKTGRIPFDFFIRALFGSAPLIPYERDKASMSLKQRILAHIGRLCGTGPEIPSWDDDPDTTDNTAVTAEEDFFSHAAHHQQDVSKAAKGN